MKQIHKYCESGDQLAATLCDLYDRYSVVTLTSTPVGGVPGVFGVGVSIDDSERENAIYMNGHCYQLTEATDGMKAATKDRCTGCALRDCCGDGNPRPCDIFKNECDGERVHFEKVKTY